MDFDTIEDVGAATVRFEQKLEELVVGSFARGVPVQGTWEVTSPLEDTPGWTITIEKVYPDGASTDLTGLFGK